MSRIIVIVIVNGQQFPCPTSATVDEAKQEIRSRYLLQGGGLEDANGALMTGTMLISETVGDVSFVGGQAINHPRTGDSELLRKIIDSNQKIVDSNQKIVDSNQKIVDANQKIDRKLTSVSKVLVQDSCPRAPSGTTERDHHQRIMKEEARQIYQCIDPTNQQQTKCMLLGLHFLTNRVICSHIISLRNRNALSRLGLSDECIWDPRNCLLLFEAFETKIESLEVVLYDDLLTQSIPVPASSLYPGRTGNLTYEDLIGRPLILPPLIFPYRRCLYFTSYFSYRAAIQSRRAHVCAENSNPTEEEWEAIRTTVATDSNCGDELAFLSFSDEEVEL